MKFCTFDHVECTYTCRKQGLMRITIRRVGHEKTRLGILTYPRNELIRSSTIQCCLCRVSISCTVVSSLGRRCCVDARSFDVPICDGGGDECACV